MNFYWLIGLIMLSQQVNMPENVLITNNGETVSISNRADTSIYLSGLPFIHTEKLKEWMDQIDKQVAKEPKNAILDKNGNIIPEQIGYRLDRQSFTEQIYSHYINNDPGQLQVPLQKVYPKVDSELLGNIRNEKIGRYETYFSASNKERNKNIKLAAEAINNFVLFPGEIFSFNQVVGQRTVEKGYRSAPVIINGKFSEDIGGGICQVSSTLFNAMDNAGIEVISRYSHSRQVSYVPEGRDATVSWNGPDLVFKNSYNQPILIQAKTLKNKLIIEVYSSDVITYMPKKVPYLQF